MLALLGCGGSSDSDEAAQRARRAEMRIQAACSQAAITIDMTLRTLATNPEVGLALAAHDAGNALLCGGDYAPAGEAALRGDVPAARAALLELRARWCPNCPPPK